MSANPSAPDDGLPVPGEKGRRALSIVWLIPIVAGAIAIWLAYVTISEKGPTVTIQFKTAEGLEAGKTKVKYKDVEIGQITEVRLADDLSHILVTAEMARETADHLTEGTRFWIVRPRVGAGGVSGLSTLISGAYVEIDPGQGEPIDSFVGMEEPPLISSDVAGREFVLRSDRLGSVSRGSPIQYKGLDVGEILGHELDEDDEGVSLHAFVKAPYDQLVTTQSRFWNVSGVNFEMSAEGVELSTGSMQSILIGGVAFDTPVSAEAREPAEAGTEFRLYQSKSGISEAAFTEAVPYLVYFDGSVRGLNVDAPVEFRGIKIGRVADVQLVYDAEKNSLEIPVVIEIEPQRVGIVGDGGHGDPDDHAVMAYLVEQGLRAQLAPGNFLTGELLVELDFHKYRRRAELSFDRHYPEIPSIPSDLEGLARSVSDVVDQLATVPIEEIGADLKSILKGIDTLVSSPDTQQSPKSLRASLDAIRSLIAKVDGEAGPLFDTLRGTLESADRALDQADATLTSAENMVGNRSQMRLGLSSTLDEIARAARSIRIFAEYLERHPEALLRGK